MECVRAQIKSERRVVYISRVATTNNKRQASKPDEQWARCYSARATSTQSVRSIYGTAPPYTYTIDTIEPSRRFLSTKGRNNKIMIFVSLIESRGPTGGGLFVIRNDDIYGTITFTINKNCLKMWSLFLTTKESFWSIRIKDIRIYIYIFFYNAVSQFPR